MLQKITNIEDFFIPVNPFKSHGQYSKSSLRRALDLIHNDRPIGIFPASEVSSL